MRVYHMSQTLKPGDTLRPDFQRCRDLAMPFVRCVDITEGYLFPDLLAKRILKRLPEKEVSTARVYGSILLGGR